VSIVVIGIIVGWALAMLLCRAAAQAEEAWRDQQDRESIARATQRSRDAVAGFQVDATWAFNAALHPPTNSPIYDQLAAERLAAELDDPERVAAWIEGAS
jgi:hypothetical protein